MNPLGGLEAETTKIAYIRQKSDEMFGRVANIV